MNETPLWASESFWKKTAIWVTAGSFLILVVLTMDSLSQTSAGSKRVPAYTVINKKIDYQYNKELHKFMPVIGGDEFLFGKEYTEEEALKLVDLGKKTTQAKNCMNCHTLLSVAKPACRRATISAGILLQKPDWMSQRRKTAGRGSAII